MKSGGKRPGSGRKPLPEGEKKIPITIKIAPLIRAYLRTTGDQTGTIERAVLRSKDYRDWYRDSPAKQ